MSLKHFLIRWPPNSCNSFGEKGKLGCREWMEHNLLKKKKSHLDSNTIWSQARQDHYLSLFTYSSKIKFLENYFDNQSWLAKDGNHSTLTIIAFPSTSHNTYTHLPAISLGLWLWNYTILQKDILTMFT